VHRRIEDVFSQLGAKPGLMHQSVTAGFPIAESANRRCGSVCRAAHLRADPWQVTSQVRSDLIFGTDPDDDEGIEQVEANGWNNEQIRGGYIR
jgi:hypothetical protein